jgi:polyphosphate kinase
MVKKNLQPSHFLNRELGLLEFNRRVLAQAADDSVPLLQRLLFLTIVSSNLDEFFEIRVAGLKEQIKAGIKESGPDGRSPAEVYELVSAQAHALVGEQYRLLNSVLLPALAKQGVVFPKREDWTEPQKTWIRDYFMRELLPVLTPIGLDPAHPFPRVLNKSLNLAIELEGRDSFGRKSRAAIVQAPRALPRVIRLPADVAGRDYAFVFLSSILHAHVDELFSGMEVKGCHQFRVTRNSTSSSTRRRSRTCASPSRASCCSATSATRCAWRSRTTARSRPWISCCSNSGLSESDLYRNDGPVNLYRLREVTDRVDKPSSSTRYSSRRRRRRWRARRTSTRC